MAALRHPARKALEAFFLSTEVSPRHSTQILDHLLSECGSCRQQASLLLSESGASGHPRLAAMSVGAISGLSGDADDADWLRFGWPRNDRESPYDSAFDAALAETLRLRARIAAEQAEAPSRVERLLGHPYERQLLMVRNATRYQTFAVCQELLAASWARRFDEPQRCVELAQAALAVSELLSAEEYGGGALLDLKARCWAEVANGLRIYSDFRGADEAFRTAADLLVRGTGSPSEVARYLDLRASLLSARSEYADAEEMVTRAVSLYRELGDLSALGAALIKKGMIAGYLGDLDREIVLVRQGLEVASSQLEARVVLVGWHNVITGLHDSGRDREALAALSRARPLYLDLADRAALLRFQWLEGVIARSLDRVEQAEGCLAEAREGFIRLGIAQDAALVSLELAALLADQGRQAEVCGLAAEMIAIFESRESRQETLAALILLRQAAERGRVTEQLVKRLLTTARRAPATA